MDEEVQRFLDVCNCSEEEASHYLSAYNNDLEAAISSYLSESNDQGSPPQRDAPIPPHNKPVAASVNRSNIATFSSIGNSNKKSEDEEEGQAFYVGGSEGGGGQQVIGPKKDKKPVPSSSNNEELITKLFENAKSSGAEQLDTTRFEGTSKNKFKAFSGAAYRLGHELGQPSSVVQGSSTNSDEASKPTVIKLWNNGFSLDDGALREFSDPNSRQFLESIQRGEVPQELLKSVRSGQANVMLEDHRNEDYKAPQKPKIVPFSGAGNMLGHPIPKMESIPMNGESPPSQPGPPVDRAKPITKLQIRLADGSRIVIELNYSHTVADIRRSVICQRPNYANTQFSLMTIFPNKELTDDSITLEEGKLLNCTLVQKIS